ncbi:MAG: hypothetical protein PF439_05735 [Helicobacteraceae bacterium]|nr:hypothetical protein [Helicobacteraceae bacterium]
MKTFLSKHLLKIIIAIGVLFLLNLMIVLFYPQLYTYIGLADTIILTDSEKAWAFRGQVGDIFAGHFTAVTMLFVVYSLLLQRKSVEQMENSIKQQSTAIIQQSDALSNQQEEIRLQSEALRAQVEEMKAQKKEFETSNIQNRFQGHFTRLDMLSNDIKFTDHAGNKFNGMGEGAFLNISLIKVGIEIRPKLRSIIKQCRFVSRQLSKMSDDIDIKDELTIQFSLKLQQLGIRDMLCWYGLHLYRTNGSDAVIWELVEVHDDNVVQEIMNIFDELFGHDKQLNQSWSYLMSESKFIKVVFSDLQEYL